MKFLYQLFMYCQFLACYFVVIASGYAQQTQTYPNSSTPTPIATYSAGSFLVSPGSTGGNITVDIVNNQLRIIFPSSIFSPNSAIKQGDVTPALLLPSGCTCTKYPNLDLGAIGNNNYQVYLINNRIRIIANNSQFGNAAQVSRFGNNGQSAITLLSPALNGIPHSGTNGNTYASYNASWNYATYINIISGGGGSLTASIDQSDILQLEFSAGFGAGVAKQGNIAILATNPTLPNVNLGNIDDNTTAQIADGYLVFNTNGNTITGLSKKIWVDLKSGGVVFDPNNKLSSRQVTLYGYNQSLPIANISNATFLQVAYTSFESTAGETQTWIYNPASIDRNDKRTGRCCYTLGTGTNSIYETNLPLGNYHLSYWSKGGTPSLTLTGASQVGTTTVGETLNAWTLRIFRINITSSNNEIRLSSASTGVKLDEVRLHPVNADMTTTTYDSFMGVLDKTDINNRSEFYEYDGFGRLVLVRAHEGNILKQTIYHYKGQ